MRKLISIFWRDQNGGLLVEMALLSSIFLLLLVLSADFMMSILLKLQVEGAARAGAEAAFQSGYQGSISESVIRSAANNSTSKLFGNATLNVSSPVAFCGCSDMGSLINRSSYSYSNSTGSNCDNYICSSGASSLPYISVTVQATYNPLFPSVWKSFTTTPISISSTVVSRYN